MSTPGAVTLKLIPQKHNHDHPPSWTLPCCVLGSISPTLKLEQGVWISSRLAQELNIQQGDVVTFAYESETSSEQTFEHAVGILPDSSALLLPSDVLIHGGVPLGIFQSESNWNHQIVLANGTPIPTEVPALWESITTTTTTTTTASPEKPHGKGVLYFHGRIRSGEASYGFYLETATGRDLVRGQGYYSNKAGNYTAEDMAYKALLDGLTWVSRIPFSKLDIVGDSQAVVQVAQSSLFPTSSMETDERRDCLKRIRALLDHTNNHNNHHGKNGSKGGVKKIHWKTVSVVDNGWAVKMADAAMQDKKHQTTCDWDNIDNKDKRKTGRSSPRGFGNDNNRFNTRTVIGILTVLVIGVTLGARWRKRV